jgi:hypothetical protein
MVAVAATSTRLGPLLPRAAEATAAAGISVLVASLQWPDGEAGAGLSGAGAAVLGLLTSTVMAVRYPWLPTLGATDDTGEWWTLALAAWAAAAYLNRDPAGRATVARPRSAPSRVP